MSYGDAQYSQQQEEAEALSTEALRPDLMGYLPRFYETSAIMKAIQEADAIGLGQLKYDTKLLLDQFFIDTATWGLNLWEKELGIAVQPNKPVEQRRDVIKAKLRGIGTVTKEMIQYAAAAYSGGETEVMEFPAEYRFVIKFVGTRGKPPNMDDLTKTIMGIKPAHLNFSYEYIYLYWAEAKAHTWGGVSTKTWDGLRELPKVS